MEEFWKMNFLIDFLIESTNELLAESFKDFFDGITKETTEERRNFSKEKYLILQ